MAARPYLVVRAHIDRSVLGDFERWYQETHLPNMMKVPGVVKAFRSNCHRHGVNWASIYEFRDDSSVQEAFASAEAAQARQDWERWLPYVSEISVEVYAALSPLPPYHHWN